jgi:hypothetical protein
MNKLLIFVLLFLPSYAFCSLEVSAVKKQQDKDYTITFCKLFKIENIALEKKSFGPVLQMPREIGGYKNLAITSKDLDLKIKDILEDRAKISPKNSCSLPVLKMVSARKIKESSSVLCQISFDDSLDIIVFASKYKKGKKEIYRVSYPQDFKILDKKYKAQVRSFILKNTKALLDEKI